MFFLFPCDRAVSFFALSFELVRKPQPETQMLASDKLGELKHRPGESLGELKAGDVRVEMGLHAGDSVSNLSSSLMIQAQPLQAIVEQPRIQVL